MPKIQTLKASVLVTIFATVIVMLYFLDNIEFCKRNQKSHFCSSFKSIFSIPSRPQPGIANDIKTDKNTQMKHLNSYIASRPIEDKTELLVSNKFKPKGDEKLFKDIVSTTQFLTTTERKIETTNSLAIESLGNSEEWSSHNILTSEDNTDPSESLLIELSNQLQEADSLLSVIEDQATTMPLESPTVMIKPLDNGLRKDDSMHEDPIPPSDSPLLLNDSKRHLAVEEREATWPYINLFNRNIDHPPSTTTTSTTQEETTQMPSHNTIIDNPTTFTTKHPISEMTDAGSSFNSSFTDLLPRSAYFDSRPRDGHDNATVILVQVSKRALKKRRVIGCGVDDYFTKQFHFQVLRTFFLHVHKFYPFLTHDQAMLTCYDLPVGNGSRAFVLYADVKKSIVLKLEAERRVYVPAKRRTVPANSSLLICTTLYGTPPWLREWLVYQKTIGVDFIHLYAQESFIAEGGANNSILQSYLKSGYAKLDVWKAHLNESQDFYHQQPLLYVDCIYRYRTEFDYVLLYDTDDFFVPQVPGETDIHYYADYFFKDEKIASIPFKWIDYYPDCGLTTAPQDIRDGNVTKHLAFKEGHWKYLKSMYRLCGMVEVQIHDMVTMTPGYIRYGAVPNLPINWMLHVPSEIAYVAHIRKNIKPSDKEQLHQCEVLQEQYKSV